MFVCLCLGDVAAAAAATALTALFICTALSGCHFSLTRAYPAQSNKHTKGVYAAHGIQGSTATGECRRRRQQQQPQHHHKQRLIVMNNDIYLDLFSIALDAIHTDFMQK